jgi:hypothetical protein
VSRRPTFVPPWKRERETKAKYEERTGYLHQLWELLKPGDTISMVLRHTSASGMYRAIDFYLLECVNGKVERRWLSYWIAHSGVGDRFDERREAVGVSGVGMDMGFHVVYNLGSVLYPQGWLCAGKDCPSNAHSNGAPRPHKFPTETYEGPIADTINVCPTYRCSKPRSEHPTKAERHTDGGYALRHDWIG